MITKRDKNGTVSRQNDCIFDLLVIAAQYLACDQILDSSYTISTEQSSNVTQLASGAGHIRSLAMGTRSNRVNSFIKTIYLQWETQAHLPQC